MSIDKLGILSVALGLTGVACGGGAEGASDQTIAAGKTDIVSVALTADLPRCGLLNRGIVYYVEETGAFSYCDGHVFQSVDLHGQDGSSCSVVDDGDGTKTIACTDGTSAIVSDGKDGTNGSDGKDGTNGKDGSDGKDGTNGTDGSSCSVTDDGKGTAMINCDNGSNVSFAVPYCGNGVVEAGEQCDGGPHCTKTCQAGYLAFVSGRQSTGGNLGGLAGADAICNAEAQAAGYPGTFMAWLSANGESPSTRFTRADMPYRLVNGTSIADDWDDLTDGTLAAPLDRTIDDGPVIADAGFLGSEAVWSNTAADGTLHPGPDCKGWTSNTENQLPTVGLTARTDDTWSLDSGAGLNCIERMPFYCFEQ